MSAAPSWVGLGADLNVFGREKSPASAGNRTQGRPAHSLFTILIILFRLQKIIIIIIISQFKELTLTVDTFYWRMEETFNGRNTECDISLLMHASVFSIL